MTDWKDCTAYRRDDKERVPTTFEAKAGPIRLCVTLSHIYYSGHWVGHAFPIFKDRALQATTREKAQVELIGLVKEWVDSASAGIA